MEWEKISINDQTNKCLSPKYTVYITQEQKNKLTNQKTPQKTNKQKT